ncbi:swim zinc finger family protein [Diplodia corticola]|uniref:Swim zinc finger family protein n=1 Tax=Diplodia corticola TaxID=236234 RepID=A0A1J9RT72_9PEZI|nr:swim zinc finger family protein [Diplodia corticola]OJD31068.1 swim zinc finger family protein [Diplodia corticola]
MQAQSGITYVVHPSIHQNVKDGLAAAGNIQVTECASTGTLSRGYLFCVREGGVDLELFVSRDQDAPLCWCQKDVLCRVWNSRLFLKTSAYSRLQHAFWLMDQIFLTASQKLSYFPNVIHIQADGRATADPAHMNQTLPSAAILIDTITINQIGLSRRWTVRKTQTPDVGAGGSNQGDGPLKDRVELLKWVLEPSDAVWHAFSRCCASRLDCDDDRVVQNVWRQFKELVDDLLDDEKFEPRLDAMLTPDFCVAAQLIQLKAGYEKVFRDIDAIEPLYDHKPTTYFIEQADKLCEHAIKIARLYDSGVVRKSGYVWYMSGLLIHIIREVVERDYSKYSNSQGSARHDDPAGNLYVRLVSDSSPEGGLMYVLKTLGSIPPGILGRHRQVLQRIERALRPVGGDTTFKSKFHEVVARCSPGS